MYQQFPDFHDHALITHRQENRTGLSAFIAVHNDNRGPAIGGCRMLKYASPDLAIKDVLRLSRGMTYKNAIADIPYGGGKAVIIADPHTEKTTKLLEAMGDFVQSLAGRYITSFDSGTTMDDVKTMGRRTEFAAGTLADAGNASDSTASGVYYCMRAAAERTFGSPELNGLTVAIQGVGNVGSRVAEKLAADSANLIIADVDADNARSVAAATGARVVGVDEILGAQADILSPCALGGILSSQTIPGLKTRVIVGGANNQLASPEDDERLRSADILYCPDYLANAGGIIDVNYQLSQWSAEAVDRHVRQLAETFHEVIDRARAGQLGTAAVADTIAQERFQNRGGRA
jgi:leucine dehydrogenase